MVLLLFRKMFNPIMFEDRNLGHKGFNLPIFGMPLQTISKTMETTHGSNHRSLEKTCQILELELWVQNWWELQLWHGIYNFQVFFLNLWVDSQSHLEHIAMSIWKAQFCLLKYRTIFKSFTLNKEALISKLFGNLSTWFL